MKKAIATADAPQAIGPYSQAIESGGLLFISGQTPLDPRSGQLTGTTCAEQTERVLKNIEAILKAAGMSVENVVKTTVFLKNMADFQAMNQVYAGFFGQKTAYPARATVEVAALPKNALVEIEAIASRN